MSLSTNSTPEGNTVPPTGPAEDPWTGQTWKIAAVSAGLEELHVNGQPPQFWLERRNEEEPAVYALKPVTPVELPECFAPSILFTQRGTVQPGPLKFEKLLPAPFVRPHTPYWDASEKIVCDDRDLMRLEGFIEMSDGTHKVRLYQVSNVLENDKTLLVLDFEHQKADANSDGTAIGHN